MNPDFTFKMIAAGDGGVGKTTLLHRYVDNRFEIDTKMTIGVEIFNKDITVFDEIKCALQIWDFGGQERFRFFLDSFVLGAQGALLLFDLTKMSSFKNLGNWVEIVRKYVKDLPIILIGSKADLENMISVQDDYAMEKVEEFNLIKFMKTSSKTGFNVNQAVEDLVVEMIKRSGHQFLSTMRRKYDLFSRDLL